MVGPVRVMSNRLVGRPSARAAGRGFGARTGARSSCSIGLVSAGRHSWCGASAGERVHNLGASPPTSYPCMLNCMQSTSVRIDTATHQELKRLADEMNTTVGNTVALAVRALRQDMMGLELAAPLSEDELAWLDADLG